MGRWHVYPKSKESGFEADAGSLRGSGNAWAWA